MFRKLRSLSKLTSQSFKSTSYERIDEEQHILHPNSDELTDTHRHGSQQAPNSESVAGSRSIDEPPARTSLESVEAPLLAEDEKEQDEATTESKAATTEEEKKPSFSTAEYTIAFSHFLVRVFQSI
jgi:hypothetical protein